MLLEALVIIAILSGCSLAFSPSLLRPSPWPRAPQGGKHGSSPRPRLAMPAGGEGVGGSAGVGSDLGAAGVGSDFGAAGIGFDFGVAGTALLATVAAIGLVMMPMAPAQARGFRAAAALGKAGRVMASVRKITRTGVFLSIIKDVVKEAGAQHPGLHHHADHAKVAAAAASSAGAPRQR